MEYVVFKGMDDILYTIDYYKCNKKVLLNHFGKNSGGGYPLELPTDPCDLELLRDCFNEVLTEIIDKKRRDKNESTT